MMLGWPQPRTSFTMKTRFLSLCLLSAALAAGLHAARRVVLISGEFEYGSRMTLDLLADQLKQDPNLEVVRLTRTAGESIPGLEALKTADVAFVFIRRMTLPEDQLGQIRDFLQAGHTFVGVRTTCHAFQNWPHFDDEVLGCHYQDHYRPEHHAEANVVPAARHDPLLDGIPDRFVYASTLYKVAPLESDVHELITATLLDDATKTEPVAWTRSYHGAKVFFTTLGDPGDFRRQPFMTLLTNALGTQVALHPIGSLPAHAIPQEELHHYLGFPSYTLLDLRPAAEFAKHHGKRQLNPDAAALQSLPKDKNYIVAGPDPAAARKVAERLAGGTGIVVYLEAPYAP